MKKLLLCFALCLFCGTSFADIIHDEAVDGDLSTDNFAPTILNVALGSNEIIGSTTFDPLDRDFFTVTIDPGFQMEAVILQSYVTIDVQSWMAIEAGPQVSSVSNTNNLLGSDLIGFDNGAQQGDDILDDLGVADFGGSGFTGPLGPGIYSFWFQETGADTTYAFNIVVSAVPEPTSGLVFGFMAIGIACRRKRS